MKKLVKNISLFLVLTLAASISLLSCGGGGGGGGGGQMSTIRGNVADVMAMIPMGEKSSMLAQLKDLLSFLKTANAQSSEVEGITVTAQQGGMTIDTDVTCIKFHSLSIS